MVPRLRERNYASGWANKLREIMEWAHDPTRTNIDSAMLRQKRYHDSKLFWESFEPADKVFGFSSLRQPGRCRKFRGMWRGYCVVKSKLSDLTGHIDNIKGYETRLDELVEKESEVEERKKGYNKAMIRKWCNQKEVPTPQPERWEITKMKFRYLYQENIS